MSDASFQTGSNDIPGSAGGPFSVLVLDDGARKLIAETKATCPFVGSAVAQGALAVRHNLARPLARIEEVRGLGNSGGGDLGDFLVLFASGNHAFMPDAADQLRDAVPLGLFSLDFPGSQGSHPGHSGILQGDPARRDSARLSQPELERLTRRAVDGWIKRSDTGIFIAENLLKDPHAKVFGVKVAALLATDLGEFVRTIGPAWMNRLFASDADAATAHRDLEEKLTRLMGEDNLVGSAGEFGLLFAFLSNKPGARTVDGDVAIAVHDVESMFLNKRFPDGWKNWKKTRLDWVKHTTALLISAARHYHTHRRER
jgi:hypothetical protein